MTFSIGHLLDQIIIKKSFINNYPKPGVVFLNIDSLFSDPNSRKMISDAVLSAINAQSFDSVAGIASRGYIFSGIIANQTHVGEQLIQKVKVKNDPHFIQIDTKTEYSSDALQVLKNTIQKGKRYLLTDDLIATGGSVMTAIELIRQCGGQVDTVFIMTELLDFGARERLKAEGVELISLLQFTDQDLQKLLALQECHAENPHAPISYQLTNYAKGKLKENMAEHVEVEIKDQGLFDLNQYRTDCYSLLMSFHDVLQYLFNALYKTLEQFNLFITGKNHSEENEKQLFNVNRLVSLNPPKIKDKYIKKSNLFALATKSVPNKSINLYNQGCPVKTWNIAPEKVTRNDFKIFSTGDAFSLLAPDVEINGAHITIHVGVEHTSYSPLVLLHEALQLCRCAYEHGARELTIALPEQFHPVLHPTDFNRLLMSLFKASGANKLYFYDKNYTGVLDESNSKTSVPLIPAQQVDFISKDPAIPQSLDEQMMQLTRANDLQHAWSKFDPKLASLCDNVLSAKMAIPAMKIQPHIVLCCSTNKPLAKKIADNLRMRGELVKLYSIEGQGELATIPKDAEICGALVTIVQSTRPNPDKLAETKEYQVNGASSYLFEAAMIAKQAQLRGADTINLINPYQFSARSDKAENNPKGKTGAYVQQNGLLLKAAGVNHVVTAECHDTHTMSGSYTGKNIRGSAVQGLSIIASKIANEWLDSSLHGQFRLVTPDAGAMKRTKELTLQLQSILGKKLCESRVVGEKQRDSHQDDSALINSLNSGTISINAEDKYLITDDETATGNTLCQAITNLKKNGAKDIAVIVIHNNMPLDWLLRQLCLTRFLYLGVNDLHFSDTQEMGTLANNYDDLIKHYAQIAQLTPHETEEQVRSWFKKNIAEDFSDKTEMHFKQEFEQFKSTVSEIKSKIRVHSLASEFANQVKAAPYALVSKESDANFRSVYPSKTGSLLFFPTQSAKTNVIPESERVLAYR